MSPKNKSKKLYSFLIVLGFLMTVTLSAHAGSVKVFGQSLKPKISSQSSKLYAVDGFAWLNGLSVESCNITVMADNGEVYQIVEPHNLQVIQKSDKLIGIWITVPDGDLLYVESQVSSAY